MTPRSARASGVWFDPRPASPGPLASPSSGSPRRPSTPPADLRIEWDGRRRPPSTPDDLRRRAEPDGLLDEMCRDLESTRFGSARSACTSIAEWTAGFTDPPLVSIDVELDDRGIAETRIRPIGSRELDIGPRRLDRDRDGRPACGCRPEAAQRAVPHRPASRAPARPQLSRLRRGHRADLRRREWLPLPRAVHPWLVPGDERARQAGWAALRPSIRLARSLSAVSTSGEGVAWTRSHSGTAAARTTGSRWPRVGRRSRASGGVRSETRGRAARASASVSPEPSSEERSTG